MKISFVKTTIAFLLCVLLGNSIASAQCTKNTVPTNINTTTKTNTRTISTVKEVTEGTRSVTLPKGTQLSIKTTSASSINELFTVKTDTVFVKTVPTVLAEDIVVDKTTTIPKGTPCKVEIAFTISKGANGFANGTASLKLSLLGFNNKAYTLQTNSLDGLELLNRNSAASSFETEMPPDFRIDFSLEKPLFIKF